MVRTLDFQSKNEGSTPSGPIINNNLPKLYLIKKNNFKKKLPNEKLIHYTLNFSSLFSPFILNKLTFNDVNKIKKKEKNRKILIKQSYILLT